MLFLHPPTPHTKDDNVVFFVIDDDATSSSRHIIWHHPNSRSKIRALQACCKFVLSGKLEDA
jgi:hypothetical protein